MASAGRPRRTTHDMIVDAGIGIGLPRLTVRGVAETLGVSEMTIYRHTGGLPGLQRLVAEGIVARQTAIVPQADDPEDALVLLAATLRDFIVEHPGIAAYLVDLDPDSRIALTRIDASQRAFADRFGWPPGLASVLVSTVAEHAVALAELAPRSHRAPREPGGLPDAASTIRAGAETASAWSPAERFDWSMRATVRGAMALLGLAPRHDTTPLRPAPDRDAADHPTARRTSPMSAERYRSTTPPHTIRPWPLPRVASPAIEALRDELAAAGEDAPAVVERFRERLAAEGTPLIEPDDRPGWSRITFVRIGPAPEGVVLQLNRISDPLDIEDTRLERIGESDVHALTLRLPDDWQGGYLFVTLPGRAAPSLHTGVDLRTVAALAQHAETDPHARDRIPSKSVAASGARPLPDYAVARGPAAPTAALWQRTPPPATALPALQSPVSGAALPLHLVSTGGADAGSPVVLLLDGEVWREQFPIADELEQRAAAGEAPGLHLLFLDSGGPMQRELDYAGDATASAALLAAAREAAGDAIPATPWIIAGQSLGGLFALLAATRHPSLVRAAIAQSPSLWWPTPPSPWDRPEGWFEEQAAAENGGAPVLLEAGVIDAGVIERARAASALLRVRGRLIGYREHRAGHDVLQWQTALADAIVEAVGATS